MMTRNRISLMVFTVLLGLAITAPALAKKSMPEINDEGMQLVKDSELATVYADPGADLGIYNKVMLMDATVAFKKHWKRSQNRGGTGLRVKDSDMDKIKQSVAELFAQVFTEELAKGGYEVTQEAGEDVLLLKPAIVDLDIHAPDIQGTSRTWSYSESAGEMTLHLELFDSLTNDKIAKAIDRKEDYRSGWLEWRTRVSNRADAKRMMRQWAKAFRASLDEARSATRAAK